MEAGLKNADAVLCVRATAFGISYFALSEPLAISWDLKLWGIFYPEPGALTICYGLRNAHGTCEGSGPRFANLKNCVRGHICVGLPLFLINAHNSVYNVIAHSDY